MEDQVKTDLSLTSPTSCEFSSSENPSVIKLRGSTLLGNSDRYGSKNDTVTQGKNPVYDKNIAYSHKPRTEYDVIVNSLCSYLLPSFVEHVEMSKCTAPEKGSLHEKFPFNASEGEFSFEEITFEDEFVEEEEYDTEESIEDVMNPNYFTKFKCRDKNVKVEFKNGNKFDGRISSFMMEGPGTYTWKDGTLFEGYFISGVAQGKGYILWPNKSWYRGCVKNNLRHGKGTYYVQKDDGTVRYCGKWKDGKRHGGGMIMFKECDWYDGQWKKDKMHGFGSRQYPSGSRYLGWWKNGMLHGMGTMVWNINDTYTGFWKRGKMHGRGTYTWRTFMNSTFVLPQQNMHYGYWKNGKRHGPGRLLLSSGASISAIWKNDKKHGSGQVICKNGLIIESSSLFSMDKIVNLGKPQTIPIWNKCFYNFLSFYKDGIVEHSDEKSGIHFAYDDCEELIIKNPPKMQLLEAKKNNSNCLNNIPFLAPVETMPLWKFVEMLIPTVNRQNSEEHGHYYLNEKDMETLSFEELWLRKVLSNRIPDINFIYQHYAKAGSEENLKFDCFLLRLMLWQLFIDCSIHRSCFTLYSLDKQLGFGSYPFDIITLSEMITYLLYLSYDICLTNKLLNDKIPGLWGASFDFFISNIALPATKKRNDLVEICKHLPLNELYSHFCFLGSPVTFEAINEFFNTASDKNNCNITQNISLKLPLSPNGKNIVCPDGGIIFDYSDQVKEDSEIYEEFINKFIDILELSELGTDVIKGVLYDECLKSSGKTEDEIALHEVSFLEYCKFVLALLRHYSLKYATFEANEENTEVESSLFTHEKSSKGENITPTSSVSNSKIRKTDGIKRNTLKIVENSVCSSNFSSEQKYNQNESSNSMTNISEEISFTKLSQFSLKKDSCATKNDDLCLASLNICHRNLVKETPSTCISTNTCLQEKHDVGVTETSICSYELDETNTFNLEPFSQNQKCESSKDTQKSSIESGISDKNVGIKTLNCVSECYQLKYSKLVSTIFDNVNFEYKPGNNKNKKKKAKFPCKKSHSTQKARHQKIIKFRNKRSRENGKKLWEKYKKTSGDAFLAKKDTSMINVKEKRGVIKNDYLKSTTDSESGNKNNIADKDSLMSIMDKTDVQIVQSGLESNNSKFVDLGQNKNIHSFVGNENEFLRKLFHYYEAINK